ncbi:MAG: polysaccharide deacetylase family protein [Clostridia bacterium]|nr:polysaccharide deacetylase family protein [Clostridia bacterium]
MNENTNFSAEARKKRLQQQRKQRRFYLLCALAVILVAVVVGVGVSSCQGHGEESAKSVSGERIPEPTPTPRPAPEIPPASEQNDLMKIAINAQGTEQKICYLTFDDGPTTEVTPAVLDVLKQYNVKATFFMLGKMIERNPELAKRVYDEGHLLANHSYSHDYGALYASGDSFLGEIEKTTGLIQGVTGEEQPFKLMRFPGGSHNAGSYAAQKQQYKLLLQEKGYYYADWNCLNGDAEGSSRTAEQLLARVKETSGAQNIVVLMHDAATKKTTADALPAVISYLQEQGYIFKRLDEIKYYGGENAKTDPDVIL